MRLSKRAGPAGNGRHVRGDERGPPRARRSAAATQQLLRSQELGEAIGLPQNRYRWRVAMARIRQAEGDLDGALDLLNEAERVYVGDFFPNVRPVPALRARAWIAQGRLGEALGWAREQGLSVDDDLSYLREFEHITLARMLLARSRVSGRALRSRGDPVPGAPPAGGGRGRPDGTRHRDPGASGARAPGSRGTSRPRWPAWNRR